MQLLLINSESMKRVSCMMAACALMMAVGANAQVGVQAGYSNSVNVDNNSNIYGFHAGPVGELTLQGPLSLQYGLFYNYLTNSNETTLLGVTSKATTVAHTLDLPVRLAISFPLADGLSVFAFGGPNFNFALSNVTDVATTVANITTTSQGSNLYTMEDSNNDKIYNPFDAQLGIGGGLKFNEISVRVSYDWGITDRDRRDNFVWKNNDLKISLSYTL